MISTSLLTMALMTELWKTDLKPWLHTNCAAKGADRQMLGVPIVRAVHVHPQAASLNGRVRGAAGQRPRHRAAFLKSDHPIINAKTPHA
jgi:hypothetical protein